jgi:hypothetical protein
VTNPFAPPTDDGSGRRQATSGGAPVESSSGILEYFPEQPRHHSSAIAWYVIISPILLALVVAIIEPDWAIRSAILGAIALWYLSRGQRKRPQATFKVEDSHVVVIDAKGEELLHVTLDELDEVTLDTKTIQRVQENVSSGGVPEIRRFLRKNGWTPLDERGK